MSEFEGFEVLLVEDDKDQRECIAEILEEEVNEEFRITYADHGLEAVNLFDGDKKFHIIITDNEMPKMKGKDFLDYVDKKSSPRDKPYVIMITGFADQDLCDLTGYTNIHAFILEKPNYQNSLKAKILMICSQFKKIGIGDSTNG